MVDVSGKTTKAPSHEETLGKTVMPFVKLSVFVPSWQIATFFNLESIVNGQIIHLLFSDPSVLMCKKIFLTKAASAKSNMYSFGKTFSRHASFLLIAKDH